MHKAPRPPQTSDSSKPIFDSNPQTLRLYQVWKGNNRFYCGGRLIFGPDVRSIFLTVFLILTPVILFCAFVSQTLINEFQHKLGYLIVAVCAVFTVYVLLLACQVLQVLFLLFLTSGRDPGIIPRNSDPLDLDDDGSTVSSDWMGTQRLGSSLPPTKDVIVNGMIIKVKYCQTCMLYRPPRCSHCSICNNCVERFDHHCPWVGQCIGKRNYRFFFMFVSSTTMLCLYVFTFCCVNVSKLMHAYNCTLWRALAKSPVSGILILYTFITVWFVGGLTAFHFYLILTNQTTYENFRYRYHRKTNPYNYGSIQNVLEIFCSKIHSSKNNFREKVKVDPSAIFAKSLSLRHSVSPEVRKKNFDIETGKQQVVDIEDFEGMHNQHISVGMLERCETEPRHRSWDHKTDWENTPAVQMLAAEYGMEHGLADREN